MKTNGYYEVMDNKNIYHITKFVKEEDDSYFFLLLKENKEIKLPDLKRVRN